MGISTKGRPLTVGVVLLMLALLPGLPGCGCDTDSGVPTKIRGGDPDRCTFCLAIRIEEHDFDLSCTEAATASSADACLQSNGQTMDVRLDEGAIDPCFGNVVIVPPFIQGLHVGDIAQFEVTIEGQDCPPGAQACFDFTRFDQGPYLLASDCVMVMGDDCDLVLNSRYIFAAGEPAAAPQSGGGTPLPVSRVILSSPCEPVPDCCFCLAFLCTDGFDPPIPGTPAVPSTKKVILAAQSIDASLQPFQILPSPETFVSTAGGVAQFEVCVASDHDAGAVAVFEFQDSVGATLGTIRLVFEEPCTPVRADPNGENENIILNLTCEDLTICCVPVTICVRPVEPGSVPNGGVVVGKDDFGGTNGPPFVVFPRGGIFLPGEGGTATFWVCREGGHDAGTLDLVICSDANWFLANDLVSDNFEIGSFQLSYALGDPCDVEPGLEPLSSLPGVLGTTIQCDEVDPD